VKPDAQARLLAGIEAGLLDAEALLSAYCNLLYQRGPAFRPVYIWESVAKLQKACPALARISHTPREKCARRAEVEALCASLRGRPEATFRLLRPAPMPSQGIGRPVLISQPVLGC